MSRYIDADEIQYTMLYKENWITNTGIEKQGVWKDDIDKMPTADVVEVVRCKDCKYQRRTWHEDKRFQDGGYFVVHCTRNGDPFVMHTVDGHDTDFCSYGERADT